MPPPLQNPEIFPFRDRDSSPLLGHHKTKAIKFKLSHEYIPNWGRCQGKSTTIKFHSQLLLEKVLWNHKEPYRLIMIITCHFHHSVQPPLTLALNMKS